MHKHHGNTKVQQIVFHRHNPRVMIVWPSFASHPVDESAHPAVTPHCPPSCARAKYTCCPDTRSCMLQQLGQADASRSEIGRAFGRGCLRSSLDEDERQGMGLRIRLRLDAAPELANLPWEYL